MKKILSIFLCVCLMLVQFPLIKVSANTASEFAGGSGTEEDPYLIATKYHLDNVRNHTDAHFKMIANIDFIDTDFWEPINEFEGVFDGNGFLIEQLQINSKIEYIGLFGKNRGCIKNVTIFSGSIKSNSSKVYIGSIAGENFGMIDNCYNSVEIISYCPYLGSSTSSSVNIGGIVGYNSGSIRNCFNNGSVKAMSSEPTSFTPSYYYDYAYVGGISGRNYNGEIYNCYNEGYVTNSNVDLLSMVGGITGKNEVGTICKCYNNGQIMVDVSCLVYSGGIVGNNNGIITQCNNKGLISAGYASTFLGGIVGENQGEVSYCYNIGNVWIEASSYGANSWSGGIAGYSSGVIKCNYNAGAHSSYVSIYSTSAFSSFYAGGIVGESSGEIIDCYNISSLSEGSKSYEEKYVGGICGENDDGIILNCYFLDAIEQGVALGLDDT
jgi:hypothetical protein